MCTRWATKAENPVQQGFPPLEVHTNLSNGVSLLLVHTQPPLCLTNGDCQLEQDVEPSAQVVGGHL